MAYPFVSASAGAEVASGCWVQKLTCLCSPTNHPGSFRCSRHRTPRVRRQSPSTSSSSGRVPQLHAAAPGATGIKNGGGGRTTSKGRPVLRAHLQRLVRPPSGGCDHRRWREFKPRLSRLGRLAAVSS